MDVTGLSLTTITLFLPMVGLFILLFMNGETQKSNLKWVAFATSVVTFVASVVMWINFDPSSAELQMVQRNTWAEVSLGDTAINVSYFVGVDGISMLLVLLTTFIMPISILCSFGSHIFEDRGREKLYYIFLLLLEWSMIGVFVVHDLIIFYVFWEVTLVPMYFLIGIWGAEERIYAAVKFFLYTMAGSILMLIAILYVGNRAGTFSTYSAGGDVGVIERVHTFEGQGTYWDGAGPDAEGEEGGFLFNSVESWLFLGFLVAFAIKVPIFPFHSWLPDAHVQAPTAGSVILGGCAAEDGDLWHRAL